MSVSIATQENLLALFDHQEEELKQILTFTHLSLNVPVCVSPITQRYWNDNEHMKFLICICFLNATSSKRLPVSKISEFVETRTAVQVRTHAQKYFATKQKGKHMNQDVITLMKQNIEKLRKTFGRERPVMVYKSL
ncbi:hypothetical protein EIN_081930 [Entamoeba invadens IP1]|uniref:hypothetical protein n=1 Tax=Entamoeba invadens IP1 TaxID=370355 RepID=UPI0002C3D23A|nr:hypothetical protein EIN_081930 [Entamoeba invadens IP1]ELP85151.1 hypothetical protein EIN_081930 [Entamoeba invadens IP1]|eukprot:XP_004184497.1 hypothetical protein EIN_081930 [Entamoeba invadens IP1]